VRPNVWDVLHGVGNVDDLIACHHPYFEIVEITQLHRGLPYSYSG
jgi:hypothetical protein